jgi:hypothetical protein
LTASRTALVATATARSTPWGLQRAPVARDDAPHPLDRSGGEAAVAVDALPESRDRQPAVDLRHLSAGDVGDEKASRVRPEVDDADPHRGRPTA